MKSINLFQAMKLKSFPLKLIIGIAFGGIGGVLFYYFVGCGTGTCPITSNPYGSILYGSIMGALVSRM